MSTGADGATGALSSLVGAGAEGFNIWKILPLRRGGRGARRLPGSPNTESCSHEELRFGQHHARGGTTGEHVHDLKISGSNDEASSNQVNELYPGIADEKEWSCIADLQQVPGDGDLGEGADAAIEADE